ncbi:unnamed protein product [Ectocarpus sp. 13 AM-2016]
MRSVFDHSLSLFFMTVNSVFALQQWNTWMRRCGNLGSSSIVQLATTSRILSGFRTRPIFAIWSETRLKLSSDCAPLAAGSSLLYIFVCRGRARVNSQLPQPCFLLRRSEFPDTRSCIAVHWAG